MEPIVFYWWQYSYLYFAVVMSWERTSPGTLTQKHTRAHTPCAVIWITALPGFGPLLPNQNSPVLHHSNGRGTAHLLQTITWVWGGVPSVCLLSTCVECSDADWLPCNTQMGATHWLWLVRSRLHCKASDSAEKNYTNSINYYYYY